MLSELDLIRRAVPLLSAQYREARRDLPWRADPEPYHVWVSEIMLQQTRIEAVLSYYDRFMREFPDVETLAVAPLDRLLKLWEGLGYYSRARNLHHAAQILVTEYGGTFPSDYEKIRSLPGIGDYTAGAISSICFGLPEPAVDGNVLRVLTRLLACDADITAHETKKKAIQLLRSVYPTGQAASDLTQGLMELGQVICIPNGEPKCALCPIDTLCLARLRKETEKYPVRRQKKARRIEYRTVFLLSRNGKYAIRQRPESGLLARMWEFPNIEGKKSTQEAFAFLRERGLRPVQCDFCGEGKHIFTHVEWHMVGFAAECETEMDDFEWKTPEEICSDYAIPSAFRAFTKIL